MREAELSASHRGGHISEEEEFNVACVISNEALDVADGAPSAAAVHLQPPILRRAIIGCDSIRQP